MTLAAAGGTWGIPGPTFLVIYLAAVVGVAALSAVHRRILFRGDPSADAGRLGPQQVAYLGGRDRLAIYTAIGGLRAAGAIGSGPGRTLVQTGQLPAGVTPLDTAVYNAAGRRVRGRDVVADQWVDAAVTQLREGLERAGLAVTAAQRRTARLWALAAGALVLLGVIRFVAGVQNDKPVGFLFPATFFAVILSIVAVVQANRVPTYAATRAIRDLRRQHTYLSPRQSPSYATYGAAGAAMGVALYGAASLYAMDPAFAAGAEIQRITASGGTSGFTGGDGGGGSSCSGGSSCGGGGGCGGGGCGG
ncbi:MAG TPA: TIGR04222 domain-containing membrane protein [Actinoplanes sp.]|nr:TIGR04222 domain-containing membrane protein [Actinoplanes sp.]